jgi:hypothetical protein
MFFNGSTTCLVDGEDDGANDNDSDNNNNGDNDNNISKRVF